MSVVREKPKYRRILLKFSGEALAGNGSFGIDAEIIKRIAQELKPLFALKVQIGIIIGGGNFFRGKNCNTELNRITVDHMGMIATTINALAMRDIFEQAGLPSHVMSALPIGGIVEQYDSRKASTLLAERIVIFSGGTGNPLVTTDTALSLRGIELNADLLLKATNVDGIYSADPRTDKKAKLYEHLTYQEVVAKELAVMDLAAFCLCRDHQMKLRVYNMHKEGALLRIILGQHEGTLVE